MHVRDYAELLVLVWKKMRDELTPQEWTSFVNIYHLTVEKLPTDPSEQQVEILADGLHELLASAEYTRGLLHGYGAAVSEPDESRHVPVDPGRQKEWVPDVCNQLRALDRDLQQTLVEAPVAQKPREGERALSQENASGTRP